MNWVRLAAALFAAAGNAPGPPPPDYGTVTTPGPATRGHRDTGLSPVPAASVQADLRRRGHLLPGRHILEDHRAELLDEYDALKVIDRRKWGTMAVVLLQLEAQEAEDDQQASGD